MAATAMTSAGTSGTAARSSMAKAYLALHDAKPGAAGGAGLGAAHGQISFQFNPSELTLSKSARWESAPARSAAHTGPVEFQGAEPSTLQLEMFFDGTDGKTDVITAVDRLFTCCVPTAASRSQKAPVPPLVVFHWGKITGFTAFVTTVSASYTLFTAEGTPIRATCAVTLQEIATEPAGQNPTSGALSPHRGRVMTSGDTLATVAYAEYGDPDRWRALAAANDIDDPMRVAAGTALIVPTAAELGRIEAGV